MTALDADQIAWLRSELGSSVELADLQERYDRLDSLRDVAIEVWRTRRTALIASPLSVTLTGVASIDNKGNVDQITKRINELVNLDDDPTDEPGEDVDGGSGLSTVVVHQLSRSRGR